MEGTLSAIVYAGQSDIFISLMCFVCFTIGVIDDRIEQSEIK
mgnify:CR=1 FL=1